MAEPYLCEIRIFGFRFAPKGYAFCDGQLLSTTQYANIFGLIGTRYGGDGVTTFALPNLQSRLAVHTDSYAIGTSAKIPVGSAFGEADVTLTVDQLPAHAHVMAGDASGYDTALYGPSGGLPGRTSPVEPIYANANSTPVAMNPLMIAPAGDDIPHNNLMPYLVMNYCIAIQGVYPSMGP